jgi:hypothetical protein
MPLRSGKRALRLDDLLLGHHPASSNASFRLRRLAARGAGSSLSLASVPLPVAGIRACGGGMADDDEPVDPVGNEPSPLLFFAAGIIPLLLVGGWFLFR